MNRKHFYGVAAAVLAIGLVWLARPSNQPQGDPQAALRTLVTDEIGALRREMEAELRRGRDGLSGPAPAPGPLLTAQPGAAPAPAAARPSPEEVRARIEQRVLTFEQRLDAEPTDPSWSSQARGDLSRTLSSPEFKGASLKDLRCGSSMCRAEMVYDSLADRQASQDLIPLRPPFNSHGFLHAEAPDSLKVAIYFSKKGSRLPTAGPEAP